MTAGRDGPSGRSQRVCPARTPRSTRSPSCVSTIPLLLVTQYLNASRFQEHLALAPTEDAGDCFIAGVDPASSPVLSASPVDAYDLVLDLSSAEPVPGLSEDAEALLTAALEAGHPELARVLFEAHERRRAGSSPHLPLERIRFDQVLGLDTTCQEDTISTVVGRHLEQRNPARLRRAVTVLTRLRSGDAHQQKAPFDFARTVDPWAHVQGVVVQDSAPLDKGRTVVWGFPGPDDAPLSVTECAACSRAYQTPLPPASTAPEDLVALP